MEQFKGSIAVKIEEVIQERIRNRISSGILRGISERIMDISIFKHISKQISDVNCNPLKSSWDNKLSSEFCSIHPLLFEILLWGSQLKSCSIQIHYFLYLRPIVLNLFLSLSGFKLLVSCSPTVKKRCWRHPFIGRLAFKVCRVQKHSKLFMQ